MHWVQDDDSDKIDSLQVQLDDLEEKLRKEETEHNDTKEELEDLKNKVFDCVMLLDVARMRWVCDLP